MRNKITLAFGLATMLSACGGGSGDFTGGSSGGSPPGGSSGAPAHGSSSSGATSGGAGDGSVSSSSSGSVGGSSSSGAPVQAGTLTAGDYDDLLNFEAYHQYISGFLQDFSGVADIPYVDINSKIAVRVTDSMGTPLFGARVVIQSEGETLVSLKTPVNGIVNFYPAFDDLTDSVDISVELDEGGNSITETVALADVADSRTIDIPVPTMSTAPSQIDIAVVVDSTGSMGDEIHYLQAELTQVLKDIQTAHADISIHAGLISYRDVGDVFVVAPYPMTEDLVQFELDLNGLAANGGGDYPEAMDQAMEAALDLAWREQSLKIILLVADAPPHDNKIAATWAAAEAARQEQIHIVPVAASGVAETAEFLMRSMAALTNSRYIFLTDDSGVGDSHDEPTIDCYVVTRLDSSIRRVIDHLVTGERVEPAADEIIRTEGNYDAGVCLPPEEDDEIGENEENTG